ncbi:unnamed protein product [Arabis nemorensis]|uniref:Protein kinase domain-containing protein n=1 Tax=Arabis nemorensis TaxID=586526 RepID=A0A565CND9_9BRAS|nr:unnamed protein product [Arabis nemorensis]
MQTSEEFVKFLGEGAYGSVDLVKYTKNDGSSFHAAVKTSDAEDYESLNREFQILCELSGYPNIVQCFGNDLELGFTDKGYFVFKLLLEYASEGSLSAFMDNYTDRKLPDYWEIDYPFVGTPIYMPPESLHDGVANKTLDLWSLGCLVLEMYTGQIPWKGMKCSQKQIHSLMPYWVDFSYSKDSSWVRLQLEDSSLEVSSLSFFSNTTFKALPPIILKLTAESVS